MQATYEFRVNSDYADRLFEPNEGKDLGSVRVVHISPNDPRFARIGELQRAIRSENEGAYFFAGWDIRYRYSKDELSAAEAFKLWPTHTFEPPGESCGTVYDESTACPNCGAGVTQISDLRLDLRKAPKSKDIARTIAGEVIVSQRLAELLTDGDFKGFNLRPVRHKARYEDDPLDLKSVPGGQELLQRAEAAGAPHPTGTFWVWLNRSENRDLYERVRQKYVAMKRQEGESMNRSGPVWHQLIATESVDIVPPTHVGINPFDDDSQGECRCPRGDTIGLNLLSELWLSRGDFANSDVARTRQCIGIRRGVIRPEPVLVVSPRLWRAMDENEIKGFRVDVAHLQ